MNSVELHAGSSLLCVVGWRWLQCTCLKAVLSQHHGRTVGQWEPHALQAVCINTMLCVLQGALSQAGGSLTPPTRPPKAPAQAAAHLQMQQQRQQLCQTRQQLTTSKADRPPSLPLQQNPQQVRRKYSCGHSWTLPCCCWGLHRQLHATTKHLSGCPACAFTTTCYCYPSLLPLVHSELALFCSWCCAGEGQQAPRMSHQPGSAKSMSSMGQLEQGSMTAAQRPHSRKDQVMLKVSSLADAILWLCLLHWCHGLCNAAGHQCCRPVYVVAEVQEIAT